MDYFKGSIFKKTNIRFKDSKRLDFRIGGHPVIVPIEIHSDHHYIYFLTFTSQVEWFTTDNDRFYFVKKGNGTGLTENSIIDLKCIYKMENANIPDMGILQPEDYNNMVQKFVKYQITIHTDDFFEEIRPYFT